MGVFKVVCLTFCELQVMLPGTDSKEVGLRSSVVMNMDVDRTKTILVTGSGGYCGVFDGTTWNRGNSDLFKTESNYVLGYMPTKNTVILATNTGQMYKSNDAGATFKKMDTSMVDKKWEQGITVYKIFGRNDDQSSQGIRRVMSPAISLSLVVTSLFVPLFTHL